MSGNEKHKSKNLLEIEVPMNKLFLVFSKFKFEIIIYCFASLVYTDVG